jgi:hypothetical protein
MEELTWLRFASILWDGRELTTPLRLTPSASITIILEEKCVVQPVRDFFEQTFQNASFY